MIVSNDEPQERAPDPTSAAERLSLAAHQKRQAKLGFVPGIDYKGPVDTADNVRAAREQLISERKRELRRHDGLERNRECPLQTAGHGVVSSILRVHL